MCNRDAVCVREGWGRLSRRGSTWTWSSRCVCACVCVCLRAHVRACHSPYTCPTALVAHTHAQTHIHTGAAQGVQPADVLSVSVLELVCTHAQHTKICTCLDVQELRKASSQQMREVSVSQSEAVRCISEEKAAAERREAALRVRGEAQIGGGGERGLMGMRVHPSHKGRVQPPAMYLSGRVSR